MTLNRHNPPCDNPDCMPCWWDALDREMYSFSKPRWPTHIGRYSVPPWLFNHTPTWLHTLAAWLRSGPSPWVELRDCVRFAIRRAFRRDR